MKGQRKQSSFAACFSNKLETDRYGRTMLHFFAYFGRYRHCAKLVKTATTTTLNARDISGRTPLYYAVWQRNKECCLALVRAGANANIVDTNGISPLHMAAYNGDVYCVFTLLAGQVDPTYAETQFQRTPLHLAAERSDDVRVLLLLIQAGATVDARDKYGNTPLFYAIHFEKQHCATTLILQGASLALLPSSMLIPEWALKAASKNQGKE